MDYIKQLVAAQKRRNEIIALRAKGWTGQRLSEKFGVSTQRIYAILKGANGK